METCKQRERGDMQGKRERGKTCKERKPKDM